MKSRYAFSVHIRNLLVAVSCAGLLVIAGCASADTATAPTETSASTASNSGATVQLSDSIDHIHGAAFDEPSRSIVVGTHSGIVRISSAGEVQHVGTATDDFMGLAVASPTSWFASGHPGPTSDQPNPLGLVTSNNRGVTWTPVSLSGEADLHILAASDTTIAAMSEPGMLRVSTDRGRTWSLTASPETVTYLAYAGQKLLAATGESVLASGNDGKAFELVKDSPRAVVIAANRDYVWAIDATGVAWASKDGGTTWVSREKVTAAQALTVAADGSAYVVGDATLKIISIA